MRQLLAELEARSGEAHSYTTVLTLTQRIAEKGYLRQSDKIARSGPASAITYSTLVPYAEALRRHAERFLAQYAFSGRNDLLIVGDVIQERLKGG